MMMMAVRQDYEGHDGRFYHEYAVCQIDPALKQVNSYTRALYHLLYHSMLSPVPRKEAGLKLGWTDPPDPGASGRGDPGVAGRGRGEESPSSISRQSIR
jgi:hypothetical protein